MNESEKNNAKDAITYLHRRLIELQGRIADLEHANRETLSLKKRILPYLEEDTIFDRNGTPLRKGDLVGFEDETDLLVIHDIGPELIYFVGGHTTRTSGSFDMLLIKRAK